MGLIDRDYMHDKRRQRPFSPPPERYGFGTLGMAFVFCVVLFFLYKVADWKLNHRGAQPASQSGAQTAQQTAPRPAQAPIQALPRQSVHQSTPNETAGISKVTKCVVNGSTSYGDAACPRDSLSSQITTRANHNLIAAVRPELPRPTEVLAEQPILVVQNGSFNDAAAKKAECQLLETQIEQWDARARQPQSAQMQDWITDQRKKARDRQFRIPCR